MRPTIRTLCIGVASVLLLTTAAAAQAPPAGPMPEAPASAPTPATPEPCWSSDDDWPRDVPAWVIAAILRCREELGLSAAQLAGFARLDADLMRESIRRQADLSLAQLDLTILLRPDPSDPGKPTDTTQAEAKIREIERISGDLAVAGLRANQAGKAALTVEQRTRLAVLLVDDPPAAARGAGPAAPGGAAAHARPSAGHPSPPAGRPSPPASHRAPPGGHPFDGRRDFDRGFQSRIHIGITPWFWPDPYWPPPAPSYAYVPPPTTYVVPPPAVVEPPPAYWYYCPSAGAYYPYVQTCPDSWITVVPRPQ
jgi:hypothetical protein